MIKPATVTNPPIDSHQKFANDIFREREDLFKNVFPQDRDQVRCQFARLVAEAGEVNGLRVFPLHLTPQFQAVRQVSTGEAFTTQIKVKATGRIYWVGFSYGEFQKAA